MQVLQARKTQYAIGFAVWLSIVVVWAFVTWAPRGLIVIADIALLVSIVILVDGGGSIYKLALWVRYRNDLDKRELIASSGQMYPKRLRQFLMDESDEQETETSEEAMLSRRRKTE
jgi:hypothetical protein